MPNDNYRLKPGDRVRIPDDGWGKPAEVTVVSVYPDTVYIERADGAIAGFWPHDIEPLGCDVAAPTVYRLALPFERPPLTANQRLHWRTRADLTRMVRKTAATLARAAKVPALGRCAVRLVWTVTDRRRRDADNLVPTLKACADGLVDAGVVADDVPELMTKHMPEIVLGDRTGLVLIVVRPLSLDAMAGILGPDWTGGLDPVEAVRRMRDATNQPTRR
ncbi:hypothetical protein [Saccharopolyspora sp. NPDC003762]